MDSSRGAPLAADGDSDGCPSPKSGGEAATDITGNTWDPAPLSPSSGGELFVYNNKYNMLPRSIGRCRKLKAIKFFGNEVEVVPPEAGELLELERLELRVPEPTVPEEPFRRMRALKELALSRLPPKPLELSILSHIAGLQCLTKLTISHFSVRFLPGDIGSLRKLEELDLSFNKLKKLPNRIAELGSLKVLKVNNNKLVDLPSEISYLTCLESLDLSSNRLTSVASLKLNSMAALQYLNLQFNRLSSSCLVPSWICCDMRGNSGVVSKGEKIQSLGTRNANNAAGSWSTVSRTCNGSLSCSHSEGSLTLKVHPMQKMKGGWKRHDCLQQRARQERLNFNRTKSNENDNDEMAVNMNEDGLDLESKLHEMKGIFNEENLRVCSSKKPSLESEDISCITDDYPDGLIKDSGMVFQDCFDEDKIGWNMRSYQDNSSCSSAEYHCLRKDCSIENELEDSASSVYSSSVVEAGEENHYEMPKFTLKSKRHPDKDNNPKPSKFRKPVDACSNLSHKYSVESFCSIDDHLPDGFYDAGRNTPFMSIKEYEQSPGLCTREVILLDREQDEQLDAIAFSAQQLLSSLKRPSFCEAEGDAVDELQRASVLALFVSDCFGGCDRSASLMRTRRDIICLKKEQPFICTCSDGNIAERIEESKQISGFYEQFNFARLCEESLQIIKQRRKSGVVPIGALQFGVCRHRAVLLKYLCDRADPPIPCELVRGHIDYVPHAWNIVPVRRGNTWTRMIVDACCPTNIKEETDPEYFCRYVPLSRHISLENWNSTPGCSFPPVTLCQQIENTNSSVVYHCKIGSIDAAAKMRCLDSQTASYDNIREFEYKLLGEVRMLGALRGHKCIVDFYGHQFFYKWVPADSDKEYKMLQSVIFMEYVKGGSLKGYLMKLQKEGKKHAPVDLTFYVAREVACALVELHSKLIIHRDIKSHNVLIDLDSRRSDGTPLIKLADFDSSVPLHALAHTCCIAHRGAPPPDVCVGTPSWMAPEVLLSRYQKNLYGLEADIWSYGCLLLEMLTLQIPYQGLPDEEILDRMIKNKQGPRLTRELEAFRRSDEEITRLKMGITSDAQADKLKLLIDLFYQCTRGTPSERPKAEQIYNSLCSVPIPCDSI